MSTLPDCSHLRLFSPGRRQRVAIVLLLLTAVTLGTLSSCKSMQYPVDVYLGPPASQPIKWLPLFKGVDIVRCSAWSPPLNIWCVRVDLSAPGVSPVVTPGNGSRPLDTDGATTADFLRTSGVQVAVNATPFGPVNSIDGSPRNIVGISESNGDRYSPPDSNEGALVFDKKGMAWVVSQAAIVQHKLPVDIWNAVGGFSIILHAGKNLGSADQRDPRTAVGVSSDHRYLYLLVVDGRQLAWSVGVTTLELASWLKYFGAFDGVNLDGGGSTTLVVQGRAGGAVVINSPIDGLVPGKMRVVGNNLGIKAEPLGNGAAYRQTLAHVAANPNAGASVN